MKSISSGLKVGLFLSLSILGLNAAPVDPAAVSKPNLAPAKMSLNEGSDAKDMKQITAPTEEAPSPLSFRMGVPAWATSISGQVGVQGVVSNIVDINFTDITSHLKYVVPGSIGIDYGKWSFLLEGQYVKLTEDFSAPISGFRRTVNVGGSVEMDQALADLNLGYKVIDTDKLTVTPFVGARFQYVQLHGTLAGDGPLNASFDETGSQAWADPILGFQTKYQLFKPMAVMAKADVGGFGAASQLTYQFFIGTETQITRNFYVSGGYRYLSTDYSSGGFTYKVDMSGPQLTFGVNF